MYNAIKKTKEKELKSVDDKLYNILRKNPTELDSYFKDFLFSKAKRLRPLFALLICDLVEIDADEKIIDLAAGTEILHAASLIHDDILDEAKTRRDKECIHKINGNKIAVLAGDYLLSCALELFSKTNESVLKIAANFSLKMSKGEITSLLTRFKLPDIKTYLNYSRQKTSAPFLLLLFGIFKIKNVKADKNLIRFASNFALCFQIKDDLNNFLLKDSCKISSDKKIGVYTLPYILKDNQNSCDIINKTVDFLNGLIDETKEFLSSYENKKKEKLFCLLDLFRGD